MPGGSQAEKCQAEKCQAGDDAPSRHHQGNNHSTPSNDTTPTPRRMERDLQGAAVVFDTLRAALKHIISDEPGQCEVLVAFFMTQPEYFCGAMKNLSPEEIGTFMISLHEFILACAPEAMSECEQQQELWKKLQNSLKPHLGSEDGERMLLLYKEKVRKQMAKIEEQEAEIDTTKACYDAVKKEMEKLLLANKEQRQERDEHGAQLAETQGCLDVAHRELERVIAFNDDIAKNKKETEKRNDDLKKANAELKKGNAKLTKANAKLTKANDELTKANDELTKANDELTKANDELKSECETETNALIAKLKEERDLHGCTLRQLHQDLDAVQAEQGEKIHAMANKIRVSRQQQQQQQEIIDALREELQCAQQARPANVTQAELTASMSGDENRLLRQLCRMFECPVSFELPEKAVLASDGHLYAENILCSCLEGDSLSPLTRKPFALAATQMLCLQDVVDVLRQYDEHLAPQGAQPPHIEGAELQQLKQQLQDAQNQLEHLEQELNVWRRANQNLENQATQAANQKKLERQRNEAARMELQAEVEKLTVENSYVQAQVQAQVRQKTYKMTWELQNQQKQLQENETETLRKNTLLEQFAEENAGLKQANAGLTQVNVSLKDAIQRIHQFSERYQ